KSIVGQIPVGRLGEAEEVARCAVFLASDEASWITGSTLTINGGQFMDGLSSAEGSLPERGSISPSLPLVGRAGDAFSRRRGGGLATCALARREFGQRRSLNSVAESLPEPAAFRMGLEVQLLDHLVCYQRFVHDLEPVLAASDLAEDFV